MATRETPTGAVSAGASGAGTGAGAPAGAGAPRTSGGGMVVVLALCCFIFGCAFQYILGVPDEVAASAGVDRADVSILVGVYSVANAIGAPVFITLMSRFDQKKTLLVALAVMAVGMLVVAVTPIFAVMVVGRCIMGVGNGAFVATAYMVAGRISGPERAASAIANVGLGFSGSFVLAPPVARMLRDVLSWQQAYLVLVGAAAVAFGIIWARLRMPPAPHAEAREKGGVARVFRRRSLVLIMAATVLLEVGYASLNTYITPYVTAFMPDESQVSGVLLAFGIMSLVGSKACGWAADRFGSARCIVATVALQIVSLAAMASTTGIVPLAVVMGCVWQAVEWGYVPVQNSIVVAHAGDDASIAISLTNSSLQAGMAVGAFVSGAAVAVLPMLSVPYLSVAVLAIALLVEVAAVRAVAAGR